MYVANNGVLSLLHHCLSAYEITRSNKTTAGNNFSTDGSQITLSILESTGLMDFGLWELKKGLLEQSRIHFQN